MITFDVFLFFDSKCYKQINGLHFFQIKFFNNFFSELYTCAIFLRTVYSLQLENWKIFNLLQC